MPAQVLIGIVLVVATVAIHAVGSTVWMRFLAGRYLDHDGLWRERDILRILILSALVLLLLLVLEMVLWALTYLALPIASELETFEEAIYFSMVTFSALGYGDITLGPDARVLSATESMNGLLLFGWTTALFFAIVQRGMRVRRESKKKLHDHDHRKEPSKGHEGAEPEG